MAVLYLLGGMEQRAWSIGLGARSIGHRAESRRDFGLGAVVTLRDVIVLTGRRCGMDMEFLNLSARVPNKHTSSIFTLKLFAGEHFYRLSCPLVPLNIER